MISAFAASNALPPFTAIPAPKGHSRTSVTG